MSQLDYLVTGAQGQLGRAVTAAIAQRGRRAFGVDVEEMPLEERGRILSTLLTHRPRWIVHCGAITNVDGCEQDPLAAHRVNGLATAWIAEAAGKIDAGLVYVSTDFVFDGSQAGTPYAVDAAPRPLSIYGSSKRLGEEAVLGRERDDHYVVRTSWVYGPGGRNFPRAILDRARAGQPLKVVTDQVGSPTLTLDLAEALLDLCDSGAPGGIYHATNSGHCSWHEFARAVLRAADLGDVEVATQLAADLARPAQRPAWSVLDNSKLDAALGRSMPTYTDAIARYLAAESILLASAAADPGVPGNQSGTLRGKEYK
ncbi:MAG: dTDP-4-dehydrorhamnose reductase [Planctomycetes bacterium]|nr:dTDP-4-dehydrorhamnose reductase [Planctomycetota bacterium]